jgi:RNA polymerase sigma-70 factor (ECF subfamily)
MISESSSNYDDFNIFSTLSQTDKNMEQSMSHEELEKQMVELIDYLPETQRAILKMRIFQDMSFKDIAESEDISINTALGRMRYALINLRKMIDKHQLVVNL